MFRQVLRAVMPWFSLQETLDQWAQISSDLAEPRRQRATQEEIWCEAEEEML